MSRVAKSPQRSQTWLGMAGVFVLGGEGYKSCLSILSAEALVNKPCGCAAPGLYA